MKVGFVGRVCHAYGRVDRISQQKEILDRTRVPQDWANAIKQVYGYRWDEHPGAKERGRILQRAYLACRAPEWGIKICPLWGEYDREYEKERSEKIRDNIGSIWVKVFKQKNNTQIEEKNWATLTFQDGVIPRVRALMGLPVRECPSCGKKFLQPSTSCQCGFPEIDPVDDIREYVEKLRQLRSEGKMLAADFDGYVSTPGQYQHKWCYAISNGEHWWQEPFEIEGKDVFERYRERGYFVFASNTCDHIGDCIQRLIPQINKKSEMGENVHHVRIFDVVKVIDPADGYSIIGNVSSESSCDYIWSGMLKAEKQYDVFLAGSKTPVPFSLEDSAGLRVQWSAFEFRPPDWTKCIRVELPKDMEQLQTMDGKEVKPNDCLPVGVEFRVIGGQRDGESFVVRESLEQQN